MNSDSSDDLRIGPEILKQQAELYRRIRNTLRWILGSLDGFTEAERVPVDEMPELERYMLHRLSELDAQYRHAVQSYEWTGVIPALHVFCGNDLSAFYFDVRKDAIYCDAPDSLRRRAARTVLDHLHRSLCTWFAPTLVFTADEAWVARFGEDTSVHLEEFPVIPAGWSDPELGIKWDKIREVRKDLTGAIEVMRREKTVKSSLEAGVVVVKADLDLLSGEAWAELAITSAVRAGDAHAAFIAEGAKCERCWRILPEVGTSAAHPGLCLRCEAVVSA
jgi:isoleucyl-tRNA synthetase